MRNSKITLSLFPAILLCCTLFFSNQTIAQTNIYIGDTANVIVKTQLFEGFNDTIFQLKEDTKRNGEIIICYDKELTRKAMICTYRRGKHQGTDRYYYQSGELKKSAEVQEHSYKLDTVMVDTFRAELFATPYRSKQYCGTYTYWYPSGQIRCQGTFGPDRLGNCHRSGQWYFWYASGDVEQVITYGNDGLKHGLYKEFYKNGKLKLEGSYHADLFKHTSYKQGTWKVYDLEGNLIRQIRYLLGMKVSEE